MAKDDTKKLDPNAWMVTFSDLITLLITFFVMLLTMSTLDTSRLKEMFQYFPGASTNFPGGKPDMMKPKPSIVQRMRIASRMGQKRWLDEHDIEPYQALTRWLIDRGMEAQTKVVRRKDGYAIHLEGRKVFDKGSTTVKPEMFAFLSEVAGTLSGQRERRLRIRVVSTDPEELTGQQVLKSNWELAANRGDAIVSLLNRRYGIEGSRLSMMGYGKSMPVMGQGGHTKTTFEQRVEIDFVLDEEVEEENEIEE